MPIQRSVTFLAKAYFLPATALVVLALLCTGCGMHLRPEPNESDTRIAGRWRLPAPQREALAGSLRAVMGQVRDKQEQQDRRDARDRKSVV